MLELGAIWIRYSWTTATQCVSLPIPMLARHSWLVVRILELDSGRYVTKAAPQRTTIYFLQGRAVSMEGMIVGESFSLKVAHVSHIAPSKRKSVLCLASSVPKIAKPFRRSVFRSKCNKGHWFNLPRQESAVIQRTIARYHTARRRHESLYLDAEMNYSAVVLPFVHQLGGSIILSEFWYICLYIFVWEA